MSGNTNIQAIITTHISSMPNGTLFFNNSFPDYDDEYVGKILSNMVTNGLLYRLGRGVYLKSVKTRFGMVYPSIEEIAKAIAERDNAQILPTGATSLNILGLSTQIPMNPTFITSGSARVVTLGNRTITFKRAVPKSFMIKGEKRRLIVQALRAIGECNLTNEDSDNITYLIQSYPELDTIEHDLKVMPVWIRKIFLKSLRNETDLATTKS